MINLYEFLEIKPTHDLNTIKAAIETAEAEKKDTRLILACKNILLNETRRQNYWQQMKFKNAPIKLGKNTNTTKIPIEPNASATKTHVAKPLPERQMIFVTVAIMLVASVYFYNESAKKTKQEMALAQIQAQKKAENAIKVIPVEIITRIENLKMRPTNIPVMHTEPNTSYTIVAKNSLDAGYVDVLVERIGSSGKSYAWREISCRTKMQRYMGTGNTIAKALDYQPDKYMSEPVLHSSAYYTVHMAC